MNANRISALSDEQERLYRYLLLNSGPIGREQLVKRFGDDVEASLDELRMLGLVLGDPPVARRPSVALHGVLMRQEAELRETQMHVGELDRLYDASHHPPEGDAVNVLATLSSIQHWYEMVHTSAEQELMQLITHPFLPLSDPKGPAMSADTNDDHPAKCRIIYEWKVFESNAAVAGLQHSVERGCEIRVADRLPHKLLIGDRALAMTPRYPRGHPDNRQMLLVHPGTLLDFLLAAFEAEWERAVPLQMDPGRFSDGGDLDADEMLILEMLARGAHVERIATASKVHKRTVNRRLDELKKRAQVETLFQLGAYAARHWLS
ncbi:helix-turn-helix transcriptional regulator [Sphaerisporangium viridialbum]|uniref:helix-turn-helix transcriptional regulator n=1 Tax=Sphaerisporangium viridialbum TaxID=46189 RepID=UPI003C71D8F4